MPGSVTITVVGSLGRDPEMRYLPDGTPVTNFTVATNLIPTNNSPATWWKIEVFGKRAEFCAENLHKGSVVMVSGKLEVDKETGEVQTWTGKDGVKHSSLVIRSNSVDPVSNFGKEKSDAPKTTSNPIRTNKPAVVPDEDEIPF